MARSIAVEANASYPQSRGLYGFDISGPARAGRAQRQSHHHAALCAWQRHGRTWGAPREPPAGLAVAPMLTVRIWPLGPTGAAVPDCLSPVSWRTGSKARKKRARSDAAQADPLRTMWPPSAGATLWHGGGFGRTIGIQIPHDGRQHRRDKVIPWEVGSKTWSVPALSLLCIVGCRASLMRKERHPSSSVNQTATPGETEAGSRKLSSRGKIVQVKRH